jgi:hypothetical protein
VQAIKTVEAIVCATIQRVQSTTRSRRWCKCRSQWLDVELSLDLGVFCARCSISESFPDDEFDVMVDHAFSEGGTKGHGAVVLGLSSNRLDVRWRGSCDSRVLCW